MAALIALTSSRAAPSRARSFSKRPSAFAMVCSMRPKMWFIDLASSRTILRKKKSWPWIAVVPS